MKKFLTALFSIVLFLACASISQAQTGVPNGKIDWDSDIRAIRLNDIPSFRYRYDDYMQFSPAAAMIVMRACGVEARSKSGAEWLSAEAFSAGIMAIAVNGIKYSVRRLRPDETTRNSFPSGHTATAFMCATMLHKEYGWRSPWISFAGYTVATFTGASRLMNHRHWCTDVLGGAIIGVGSVELGYLINDAIFKKKNISDIWEPLVFDEDKSLSYYSLEALYGHRYGVGGGQKAGSREESSPFRETSRCTPAFQPACASASIPCAIATPRPTPPQNSDLQATSMTTSPERCSTTPSQRCSMWRPEP